MTVLLIANQDIFINQMLPLFKKLSKAPEIIESCVGFVAAKKFLDQHDTPDIIFNLCDHDVEAFFLFHQQNPTTSAQVFIAQNDKMMSTSFLFNTLQFFTETMKIEDLKFCLDKYTTYYQDRHEVNYVKDLQKLTQLLTQKEKEFKKRFMVKVGNVIKSVNIEDIAYFYSQDRINYLVKYNGKKFPIDNTLDEVEEMIDPDKYFRANRQFIINIDSIAEIHPYFKGRVKLNLNPQQEGELVISAEKSRNFKDWLDE